MFGVIAGLESHWLFEPFTSIALDTVGLWYGAVLLVMIVLNVIGEMTDFDPDIEVFPDHFGLAKMLISAAVAAPLIEEGLFRILPHLLGASFGVMLALTVLWVLLHGIRAPVVSLFAPIYLKLVLGGFLFEAVLLHAVHNTAGVLIHYYVEDD